MKGYIATYNFKCCDITYAVEKTYHISGMEIFSHGFHFCKNAKDTLINYPYNKDFVLLEIEAIGKIATIGDTSVTDEIKIVRVISQDEYLVLLGIQLDERGNKISEKYLDGSECVLEYDSNNNKISEKYSDGSEYEWEYDSNNNKISQKNPDGSEYTWNYDSNNNMIHHKNPNGSECVWKYDSNNNKISEYFSDGSVYEWEYDSNNNKISQKSLYGTNCTWVYDSNNNVIGYQDARGKSWVITIK